MVESKDGGKQPSVASDIRSQVIISFDSKIGEKGHVEAKKALQPALEALLALPLTLLRFYISNPPESIPASAIAIAHLGDPAFGLRELRNAIKENPKLRAISHVEPNAPVKIATTAFTDPLATEQWALEKLGVTAPWTVSPPMGKTVVAIIDSGLRRPDGSVHVDLGRIEALADCQPQDGLGLPLDGFYLDNVDDEGHGTMLAGTISTMSNNGEGIASAIPASWNISLLPVKFFSAGAQPDVGDAIIAIYHALDMGANVINASWHVALGDEKQALKDAFRRAKMQECLVVVAAGNDGTNNETYPTYPANYGSQAEFRRLAVLTVAATDRHDDKATFSNYGPAIIDIAAPGKDILTTGPYLGNAPPRYRIYHGTSASAAFASAAAALVMALNRQENWKAQRTIEHLIASADAVPQLGLAVMGGKRLNIKQAVEGPLHVTAPTAADTLVVGTPFTIRWISDYVNPHLDKVKIEYSKDNGTNWRNLDNNTNTALGMFVFTPATQDVTGLPRNGMIRVTPKRGNFPAYSASFRVAAAI